MKRVKCKFIININGRLYAYITVSSFFFFSTLSRVSHSAQPKENTHKHTDFTYSRRRRVKAFGTMRTYSIPISNNIDTLALLNQITIKFLNS